MAEEGQRGVFRQCGQTRFAVLVQHFVRLRERRVLAFVRRAHVDHRGDWARASEIEDDGCIVVRPDQHVAWRAQHLASDPAHALRRVLRKILAR